MAIDVNAICDALLERLKAKTPSVKKWTRRDLTFDQIPADQQPAVAVTCREDNEEPRDPFSLPSLVRIWCEIQVYMREDKSNPEAPLAAMVKNLKAALERNQKVEVPRFTTGEFYTTLGGLVRYARPSGKTEYFQGAEGDQAVATIQVEMLAVP